MMRNFSLILVILFSYALAGSAYELREWEDQKGNRVKGRFVREMFDKLTVEDDEGNQSVLEIADLSDMDKKYIRVMIPPRIEVVVRTKSDLLDKRPMTLYRDDVETLHKVTVSVSKKSQRPFTGRLHAELFLVAEEIEGSNYILLNRTEETFSLSQQEDYEYRFSNKPFKTVEFTDEGSKERKGELYKGHLVIISTMQGDVLATHSSLPTWMQQPDIVENLRRLSVRGAPSVRSRHFDKTGKKVPPPRPSKAIVYGR